LVRNAGEPSQNLATRHGMVKTMGEKKKLYSYASMAPGLVKEKKVCSYVCVEMR
jgi:hypothetical protein